MYRDGGRDRERTTTTINGSGASRRQEDSVSINKTIPAADKGTAPLSNKEKSRKERMEVLKRLTHNGI